MVDRATRFARIVAKLKAPTSSGFVLREWEDAFAAGATTDDDHQLLEAARWIGTEAAAALGAFSEPILHSLSSEWGTILAVAVLNREYRTATELLASPGFAENSGFMRRGVGSAFCWCPVVR